MAAGSATTLDVDLSQSGPLKFPMALRYMAHWRPVEASYARTSSQDALPVACTGTGGSIPDLIWAGSGSERHPAEGVVGGGSL